MMSDSKLISWPPSIPIEPLEKLRSIAILYALSNSLILKPITLNHQSAIHAPFTLFPTPFPRHGFEKALRIQTSYNKLYSKISSNSNFLRKVIGNSEIIKVDKFINNLYQIWDKLEKLKLGSKIHLGIFRSDYLIHQQEGEGENQENALMIKQVEFNTISVSFGCLGTKASGLHRYLTTFTNAYSISQLPKTPNDGISSISKGITIAHNYYRSHFNVKGPLIILMIVQPNERNVFDQALLIHTLAEQEEGIRTIRLSCDEILSKTELDPLTSTLYYIENSDQKTEVSIIYYRCMYGPEDFLNENNWIGRERLESSRSINCPNLSTQLSGCKKIQQILTEPNVLIDLLELNNDDNNEKFLNQSEIDEIISTWMPIYSLNEGTIQIALNSTQNSSSSKYVLKPQREGGGHNIYDQNIPNFIKKSNSNELKSYILMKLIKTPKGIQNVLIRPDSDLNNNESLKPVEVISELGVLGVCLYKTNDQNQLEFIHNVEAGHILRTKNSESDEGGIAIGISCLDSPYLI
ncbi:hypothetical protein CROQUDRAFT_64015 [Cronartium quercuum f. sp. fusiforme G11]|uniref:Glutathione synthetase n=1 Tax=Cronartium quercuum f. sp. fusiforme G11 TaxID=708437 RepID=A0A9P6NJG8_9BASI|nr:hypothetical protein CROQUDRAFT_64015 [Cronartium quercuum f. sp. fusiforme G11]